MFLLNKFRVAFPVILLRVCGEIVFAVKERHVEVFMIEGERKLLWFCKVNVSVPLPFEARYCGGDHLIRFATTVQCE